MRTIVDIPEDMLEKLSYLGETGNKSRAAMVREAIQAYIIDKAPMSIDEAFGVWSEEAVDGLSYQEKLRSEWD